VQTNDNYPLGAGARVSTHAALRLPFGELVQDGKKVLRVGAIHRLYIAAAVINLPSGWLHLHGMVVHHAAHVVGRGEGGLASGSIAGSDLQRYMTGMHTSHSLHCKKSGVSNADTARRSTAATTAMPAKPMLLGAITHARVMMPVHARDRAPTANTAAGAYAVLDGAAEYTLRAAIYAFDSCCARAARPAHTCENCVMAVPGDATWTCAKDRNGASDG
jgi:hypothetical protein